MLGVGFCFGEKVYCYELRVAGCELRGKEGKVKNYKDLEIYKLSYDLAIKIHPVRNKRQELCFILT